MAEKKFLLVFSLTPQDAEDFASFKEKEKFKIEILRKILKYAKFTVWLIKTKPKTFGELYGEYLNSITKPPEQPPQSQQPQPTQQQPQQPTQNEVKPNG
jgi:hypothetical protein